MVISCTLAHNLQWVASACCSCRHARTGSDRKPSSARHGRPLIEPKASQAMPLCPVWPCPGLSRPVLGERRRARRRRLGDVSSCRRQQGITSTPSSTRPNLFPLFPDPSRIARFLLARDSLTPASSQRHPCFPSYSDYHNSLQYHASRFLRTPRAWYLGHAIHTTSASSHRDLDAECVVPPWLSKM